MTGAWQDYRAALSDRTALVLKVHPSNYRVTGFAEAPGTESLARLARGAADGAGGPAEARSRGG